MDKETKKRIEELEQRIRQLEDAMVRKADTYHSHTYPPRPILDRRIG